MRSRPWLLAGAAAAAILTAATAQAATFVVPFGASAGSQTLGTALDAGDGLLIQGAIQNQPGPYANEVVFTLGEGAKKITSAATWFALAPIANSLSYALFDAADMLLAEDVGPVFPGNGTVSSSLVLGDLTPGATYKLKISGTGFGDLTAYQVAVSVTPIPAAALLLGTAMAGLGYLGYRRRLAR